jgi:hypothetical protein
MPVRDDDLRTYRECRDIIRAPAYSKSRSATLIGWLQSPSAAISDIAGKALLAIGTAGFDDLLALLTTTDTLPWPMAVWALSLFESEHERLLPFLRSWLAHSQGDLQDQCAVSLSQILISRKEHNQGIDQCDLDACLPLLERAAIDNPASRVHLRDLSKAFHS